MRAVTRALLIGLVVIAISACQPYRYAIENTSNRPITIAVTHSDGAVLRGAIPPTQRLMLFERPLGVEYLLNGHQCSLAAEALSAPRDPRSKIELLVLPECNADGGSDD